MRDILVASNIIELSAQRVLASAPSDVQLGGTGVADLIVDGTYFYLHGASHLGFQAELHSQYKHRRLTKVIDVVYVNGGTTLLSRLIGPSVDMYILQQDGLVAKLNSFARQFKVETCRNLVIAADSVGSLTTLRSSSVQTSLSSAQPSWTFPIPRSFRSPHQSTSSTGIRHFCSLSH